MVFYSILRMVVHLFYGMFVCACILPFLSPSTRQARIRRWSAGLVKICGIKIVVRSDIGSGAGGGNADGQSQALIVSNHVSWLDIFVINSLQPCRFVAKSDIRRWPLIGWLCARTGTIFIARGKPADVRMIFQNMVASIRAGDRIAVFPEGTTAAQGELLPFHANLFEAAIDAGVPVQPYAVRYRDRTGRLDPAVNFIGDMTIAESILSILRARGLTAELIVLAQIPVAGLHRRAVAAATREAIGSALGKP